MEGFATKSPSNQIFSQAWNRAMEPYKNTPGMRFTQAYSQGGEGKGNLAYSQDRPAGVTSRVSGSWANLPSDPQAFFSQRDAFIQRLNEERGRQSAQAGVYGPNETPTFYRPSRDFGAMWKQAGDMVSDGWTNPLAGLFS